MSPLADAVGVKIGPINVLAVEGNRGGGFFGKAVPSIQRIVRGRSGGGGDLFKQTALRPLSSGKQTAVSAGGYVRL